MTDAPPGTDLAQTTAPGELAAREAELIAASGADYGQDRVKLPLLQLTQKGSKAVEQGKYEGGHFINSLTGKDYGEETELVVVYQAKGRFLSIRKTGQTFVAFGDIVPANWPQEYAGKRFDELPDAEETFKERVNADEIEWDSGPPIQTTRNFVGFVPDDDDEQARIVPVRLSLKSTGTPAAQRIKGILDWSFKAPWHGTVELSRTQETDRSDNSYFVVRAAPGRETTDEEREAALAMLETILAHKDDLQFSGDVDESAEQRAAKREAAEAADDGSGLAVSD